jgi:charged multivesicular body protein 2A
MGNSLGTEKTLQEELDESKRAVNRAIRELDRERMSLQTHEQQHIAEIKRMAKEGQSAAAKLMVKDLVRMSKQITQFYTLRSQLQAVAQLIEVRWCGVLLLLDVGTPTEQTYLLALVIVRAIG